MFRIFVSDDNELFGKGKEFKGMIEQNSSSSLGILRVFIFELSENIMTKALITFCPKVNVINYTNLNRTVISKFNLPLDIGGNGTEVDNPEF